MKRFFYALLVVAATLTFVSCNEDIEENVSDSQILESNTIAFTLKKNELDTRSESGSAIAEPESYPLGDPIDGQQVYLKETVVSLDNIYYEEPETKGTPVYTENFATVSDGSFKGLAFPVATMPPAGSAVMSDGLFTFDGNRWLRDWNNWGSNDELLFYARMLTEDLNPNYSQRKGVLAQSYQYLYSNGKQSMTFSYRSPDTAAEMQDVLFAARPIAKSGPTPIPLVFYHALTGVKFATAHANSALNDVNTYIKKVEFTGIYGYGKCTVTSTTEGSDYTDIPSDHSSARAISWVFDHQQGEVVSSLSKKYSQEFSGDPVNYTSGSFTTQGDYPSSFSAAGNKGNLNDGDATMTFWFPPQVIGMNSDGETPHESKLTITFDIEINGTRKEYTREINLNTLTSNGEWKAGELRTLTLLSTEVVVEIEDTVENNVKKDVVITNMGNTPAYMRVQIVGNWYGKAGTEEGIAMGYKSQSDSDMEYVEPWNDVLNTSDDYVPYGTFSGLPGNHWIKGTDGYFYYTEIVYPGESIPDKIFTSYTLDTSKKPTIYYTNNQPQRIPFEDVHLVIDIPVQAVMAPFADNWTVEQPAYKDYKAAWETAGVTAPEAPTTVNP